MPRSSLGVSRLGMCIGGRHGRRRLQAAAIRAALPVNVGVCALSLVLINSAAAGAAQAPVGALSQLRGKAGCISANPRLNACRHTHAELWSPADLEFAPDSRHLYVVAGGPFDQPVILSFRRDASSGKLRFGSALHGCDGDQCPRQRLFSDPTAVTVSPDGRNAYLSHAELRSSGVNVYSRSTSGALLPPVGTAPCVSSFPSPDCTLVPDFFEPGPLSITPDGRSAYAASATVDDPDTSILREFSRDPQTGGLQALPETACLSAGGIAGCIAMPIGFGVDTIVASPDGRNVYTSYSPERESVARNGFVYAFSRDPATGALTPLPGTQGCISARPQAGCARGRGLKGARLLISPDGRSVYAASPDDSAVAILARNPQTGALSQPPGKRGCLQRRGRYACARDAALFNVGAGFAGPGRAISPDGRNLYLVVQSMPFAPGSALLAYTRNRKTGALEKLPGRAGCVAAASKRCTGGRGLGEDLGISIAPDGRNLYIASQSSGIQAGDTIAIFKRRRA